MRDGYFFTINSLDFQLVSEYGDNSVSSKPMLSN